MDKNAARGNSSMFRAILNPDSTLANICGLDNFTTLGFLKAIAETDLKPSGIEENMEKNIAEFITQKDPNELVISGKEMDDVAAEREDRIEPTINSSLDLSIRIDNTQQTQEKQEVGKQILEAAKDLEMEENMDADDIESSVHVNMECEILGKTTSLANGKTENFSNQFSAILSDIESIQLSVDKKAIHSNTESKNLSQPSSGLGLLAQYGSDNHDDDKVSDTDFVIEFPSTSTKDYRNNDDDDKVSDTDSVIEFPSTYAKYYRNNDCDDKVSDTDFDIEFPSTYAKYRNNDDDDKVSDTDFDIEFSSTYAKDYRNQVVELNSDSDVEYLNEIRKTIEKRIEVADEDDEDEEDDDTPMGETTSLANGKTEDFSIQFSAILSGIESIQLSVDKKATHSNTESKNLSQPSSGLSLLAQYGSDNDDDDKVSDTDFVIEFPSTSTKYRNNDEYNKVSDTDFDIEFPSTFAKYRNNKVSDTDFVIEFPSTSTKYRNNDDYNKVSDTDFDIEFPSTFAKYRNNDDDDKVSDTDFVIEFPSNYAKDYRNQVMEINSGSDVEYLNAISKTIEKRIEVANEDDEDEEDDNNGEDDENVEGMVKKKHKQKLKVKGEILLEDLPPIQDLQITVPEDECIELGKILSIIDELVFVSVLPNAILLNLETVIFLERGQKVLGEVFDVLGQVDPLYCIRFNSNKQIKEKDIKVGDVVYVAPKTQYTKNVILSSLIKLKGSDASWENDIEPPLRFLDYSYDEQEQMARRQLRNKDRPNDYDEPQKKPRISDGGDQSENRSYTLHHRNRYAQQRDNNSRVKSDGGSYNSYPWPRYNSPYTNQKQQPHQQQQQLNYRRSSWHSNYYPQQYQQAPPSQNYFYNLNNRGQSQQNQSLPLPQAYPSQVPMFAMPPIHAMRSCSPPPMYHSQGSAPHMAPQQLMPKSFTIRPPTLHGGPHPQQFTSPPPPPGAK